jgi:hypothetical protein
MREYLLNISVLFSQTVNAVLLFGHPDQTVSARAYAHHDKPVWGRAYRVFNAVFFWQIDHCKESHNADIRRARDLIYFESKNNP